MQLPKTVDVTDFTDTRSTRMAFVPDNGAALMEALGAPPRTKRITIDIEVEEITTITYVTYADTAQLAALGRVYERDGAE